MTAAKKTDTKRSESRTATPCAWTAIGPGERGEWAVYEDCEGGDLIIEVDHSLRGQPDPDNERLAKFIAQAPAMLDALGSLVARCEAMVGTAEFAAGGREWVEREIEKARAILAAIEGGQS